MKTPRLVFKPLPSIDSQFKIWGARYGLFSFVISYNAQLRYTYSVKRDGTAGVIAGGNHQSFMTFELAQEECNSFLRKQWS